MVLLVVAIGASIICFGFQILSLEVLDRGFVDMTLTHAFIDNTKLLAMSYLLYQFVLEFQLSTFAH